MPHEILWIGAGAVGAFYASRLVRHEDVRVSVVCRSNYDAVSASGYTIKSGTFGEYTFKPHRVYPSTQAAAESGHAGFDYVVVSTKALPDVGDQPALLDGLAKQDKTIIVLIQNGLGIEEPYVRRFPSTPIITAVTVISAGQAEPDTIVHYRWSKISMGAYAGDDVPAEAAQKADAASKTLTRLFQGVGLDDAMSRSAEEMQQLRWHKLAINASMNTSAVLSGGCRSSEMMADEELRAMIRDVLEEVFATAKVITGRDMPGDLPDVDSLVRNFQGDRTDGKASMLLDWEAGRKMELEVILGNPLRLARKHGLAMPLVQMLYALLRMAQVRREQKDGGT